MEYKQEKITNRDFVDMNQHKESSSNLCIKCIKVDEDICNSAMLSIESTSMQNHGSSINN